MGFWERLAGVLLSAAEEFGLFMTLFLLILLCLGVGMLGGLVLGGGRIHG